MGKLLERLRDPGASGVYRASRVDAIVDAVRGSKLNFATIALQGITDKAALLRKIAAELGFPDWFGENWDALEDCLTDLTWRQAQGLPYDQTVDAIAGQAGSATFLAYCYGGDVFSSTDSGRSWSVLSRALRSRSG